MSSSFSIIASSDNFSYFPIHHQKLEEFVIRQENVLWMPSDISFDDDRCEWNLLDPNIKNFVKFILFFFAQVDGIINENLFHNFKTETSFIKEATHFYTIQSYIELVHNKTYSMLIELFISDPVEKTKAFEAVKHYPVITAISDWMYKYMDNKVPLLQRIIAFVCVEGILFCSSFAGIYWIKRRNVLKGLLKANEFIARDEALHTEFGIELYHTIVNMKKEEPVPKEIAHSIVKSAVKVCEQFTFAAAGENLPGLKCSSLVSYIKCSADYVSDKLGFKKIYNVKNECSWMMMISLPNKTNFFEGRVSEYAASNLPINIGSNCEF